VSRRAAEAEAAERADWLRLAMDALTPPELRETLVLVLEGLNHAQVAEILGVSEGTISWRISEAKKKLKAMKERDA
jgi:RNA polymerase sigma-70 factor (ECF subfamily)